VRRQIPLLGDFIGLRLAFLVHHWLGNMGMLRNVFRSMRYPHMAHRSAPGRTSLAIGIPRRPKSPPVPSPHTRQEAPTPADTDQR
jgi:hypothetical protein